MSSYQTRNLATYATGTRRERSLALLVRLNEARAIGQRDAAAELDLELERHDQQRGFSRSHSVDYGRPVPMHGSARGPQRNPNWREAMDKLNEKMGRRRPKLAGGT